jgi:hypothetical protein
MPRLAPKELKLEAKEREHRHWYRLARSYKRCNTGGSRNQANLE